MTTYKIKSHAKINLSLKVLGKLKSGLHKIETLVTFLSLHDEIEIKKNNDSQGPQGDPWDPRGSPAGGGV